MPPTPMGQNLLKAPAGGYCARGVHQDQASVGVGDSPGRRIITYDLKGHPRALLELVGEMPASEVSYIGLL